MEGSRPTFPVLADFPSHHPSSESRNSSILSPFCSSNSMSSTGEKENMACMVRIGIGTCFSNLFLESSSVSCIVLFSGTPVRSLSSTWSSKFLCRVSSVSGCGLDATGTCVVSSISGDGSDNSDNFPPSEGFLVNSNERTASATENFLANSDTGDTSCSPVGAAFSSVDTTLSSIGASFSSVDGISTVGDLSTDEGLAISFTLASSRSIS
mmetsp:Transcript_15387/g.31191  ORF Transcript_15387/g.31191 Transcript_15387/m.31191 type:complete len:210 (+) Transcript_15387:652-1281(+)